MQPASEVEASADRGRERPGPPRRIDTAILLERAREIVIVHRGQEYRLRVTRSDKLILTK